MNRRMALLLTAISSGLLPARLLAQDRPRRDLLGDPSPADSSRSASSRFQDDEFGPAPENSPAEDAPPANFREETGHTWRSFDIARYTSLAYSPENPTPQNAITEWIFRRTGSAIWHGEKLAALSAGRAQLRAYHNPRVLKSVEDVVERFTKATADVLSVRVRFVAAQDTRWRYAVASRLNRVGTGPQGQQIWTMPVSDAALILAQMQVYQGFKPLADQRVKMINGQTLNIETLDGLDYVAGPQRDSAVGLGFQPSTQQLKEGVVLRFSPLLTYDGDALDAAIDVRANTIKRLIRTKILTRREIGPGEMTIDVPEVTETRLNQTVQNWPLGQTLLISAGITPGILQSKTGFLNLRVPGTVPTDTELLVFIDVETTRETPQRTVRRSSRDRGE